MCTMLIDALQNNPDGMQAPDMLREFSYPSHFTEWQTFSGFLSLLQIPGPGATDCMDK